MTVVGLILAAEQTGISDGTLDEQLLYTALFHESQELALVAIPVMVLISVAVQHLLGRG